MTDAPRKFWHSNGSIIVRMAAGFGNPLGGDGWSSSIDHARHLLRFLGDEAVTHAKRGALESASRLRDEMLALKAAITEAEQWRRAAQTGRAA